MRFENVLCSGVLGGRVRDCLHILSFHTACKAAGEIVSSKRSNGWNINERKDTSHLAFEAFFFSIRSEAYV